MTDHDVIIIGAGITGINAAYRLQTTLPHLTYTILERRAHIGGTWDFFRYPGIRSDSDLHTMGFAWKPWTKANPIADGASIVEYVRRTAAESGIDKKVQCGRDVVSLDWCAERQVWDVGVVVVVEGGGDEVVTMTTTLTCRFVIAGTGFFDYKQPRQTTIPGIQNFQGRVVHPQFWPEADSLDYTDKKVVIVGSGATAVTIFPIVAQTAAKTTMVQRSPTYIMSVSLQSPLDDAIRRFVFPSSLAHTLVRWRWTLMAWLFFYFTRLFPSAAMSALEKLTMQELPEGVKYDPNFRPTYNVWDQRLCVCPDGDFFKVLGGDEKERKAEVMTGVIKDVLADCVVLESGETIPADVIVTATGLKLQTMGGARITLHRDGSMRNITVPEQYMWRGTMLQDVPNLMLVIGYWNNSWTLGADLATRIFIKCIQSMERQGATSFTPTLTPDEEKTMQSRRLWDMSSTYLQAEAYPKAGDHAPWTVKDNYLRDWGVMMFGDLRKGLKFERPRMPVDEKRQSR